MATTQLTPVGVRFQAQDVEQVQAAIKALTQVATQAQRQVASVGQQAATSGRALATTFVNAGGEVSSFGKKATLTLSATSFAISEMAATGTTSFRTLANSVSGFLTFFGTGGLIAGAVVATGAALVAFFTRQKQEIKALADEMDRALVQREKRENPLGVAKRNAEQFKTAIADAERELDKLLSGSQSSSRVDLIEGARNKLQKLRREELEARTQGAEGQAAIDLKARADADRRKKELEEQLRLQQELQASRIAFALGKPSVVGKGLVFDNTLGKGASDANVEHFPGLDPATLKPRIELSVAEMHALFSNSMSDAARQLQEEAEGIGQSIASGVIGGFATGLGDGSLGDAFKNATQQFLDGLGSFALKVAVESIKVGQLIAKIQAFMAAHPLLAVAAAITLLAVGRSLGGSGSAGGGAGGGALGGGGGTSLGNESLRLLIADPNAGLNRREIAPSLAPVRARSPLDGVTLLSVDSTTGGRILWTAIDKANARGVRR